MNKIIRDIIGSILRGGTRTFAFLRKDTADFIRQPRLALALVLGPFLILLLFGLGFKSEALSLRTLIVVAQDNPLRPYVEENANYMVKQLILEGIIESESSARSQLARGKIDVVIIVPSDAEQKIRSNKHAVFVTLHNAIDPMQTSYIQAFTNVYVNEANRRAQLVTVQQGQEQAAAIEPEVESARDSAAGVRQALERGDREAAQREMLQLHQDLSVIQAALGPAQWLAIGLDEITGRSGATDQTGEPQDVLLQIQKDMEALDGIGTSQLSDSEGIDAAAKLERQMGHLETAIETFRREDPHVLVSPFAGETRPIGNTHLSPSDYYVPATIVLLLQHLCVTFGGLSIVSERRTGTMELFQASPLAAIEVLVGKYLGYWLAGVVVASVLTGLLLFLVQVPMLGSWWEYVATLAALMFTSLGLGFLISILARSISQAVQYSMITLLASAFFSGFLLSLDMLRPTVRLVSWLIPASYGIQLLQDVMLRGVSFQAWRILILTGMGLVLFIVAWRGLRREMART